MLDCISGLTNMIGYFIYNHIQSLRKLLLEQVVYLDNSRNLNFQGITVQTESFIVPLSVQPPGLWSF